jgi:hypothetical protein
MNNAIFHHQEIPENIFGGRNFGINPIDLTNKTLVEYFMPLCSILTNDPFLSWIRRRINRGNNIGCAG